MVACSDISRHASKTGAPVNLQHGISPHSTQELHKAAASVFKRSTACCTLELRGLLVILKHVLLKHFHESIKHHALGDTSRFVHREARGIVDLMVVLAADAAASGSSILNDFRATGNMAGQDGVTVLVC